MTSFLFDLTDLDSLVTEKLSRGERVKKSVKNFGVELEVAHADGDTDEAAEQLNEHFEDGEFAGSYIEFRADQSQAKGEHRWWAVVTDGSAGLGSGGDPDNPGEEVVDTVNRIWSGHASDWARDYYESRAEDLEQEYDNEHDNAVSYVEDELSELTKDEADDALASLLKATELPEKEWWDDEEDDEEDIEPSDIELTSEAQKAIIKVLTKMDADEIESLLSDADWSSADDDEIPFLTLPRLVDFEDRAKEEGEPDWDEALASFLSYHADADGQYVYDFIRQARPDEDDPDVHSWWYHLDPSQRETLVGEDAYEDEGYSQDLEIVSPRFASTDANIDKCSEILNEIPRVVDGRTHPSAGLHVHVGLTQGMVPMDIMSMLYNSAAQQSDLMSKAGRGEVDYVHPIKDFQEKVNEGAIASFESGDISHLMESVKSASYDPKGQKYRVLNVHAAQGKGTVEMRIGSSELVDHPDTIRKWLRHVRDLFNESIGNEWIEVVDEGGDLPEGTKLRFNIDTAGRARLQSKEGDGEWKDAARGDASIEKGLNLDQRTQLYGEMQLALATAKHGMNKQAKAEGKEQTYRADTASLYHFLAPKTDGGWESEEASLLSNHTDEALDYLRSGNIPPNFADAVVPYFDMMLNFGFVPTWEDLRDQISDTKFNREKGAGWANLWQQKRYKRPGYEEDEDYRDKQAGRMKNRRADRAERLEKGRSLRGIETDDLEEDDIRNLPSRSGQAKRAQQRRWNASGRRRNAAGKAFAANKDAIDKAISAIPDQKTRKDVEKMAGRFDNYVKGSSDFGDGTDDPRSFIRWVNRNLGRKVFEGIDLSLIGHDLVTEALVAKRFING